MNIYVFENVENLTNREHSEGGLVVVAADVVQARVLLAASEKEAYGLTDEKQGPIEVSEEEWANVCVYPLAGAAEPHLFPFPNAGCC